MKNEPQRRAHRDSNPRSMAWETSAFLLYYYPMWLYTRIHNLCVCVCVCVCVCAKVSIPIVLKLRGSTSTGGDVSSVLVRDSPPPPPCPPGQLSCQGSTATGHTYGGTKSA